MLELEEHFDDELPPRTAAHDKEQERISERLFTYLMEGEEDDQRGTPGLNLLKVFKEALTVTQTFCGDPYVSDKFMLQVQYAIKWMVTRLSFVKPPDMGGHEYQIIMHSLQECKHWNNQTFLLQGTMCANKARVICDFSKVSWNLYWKYIYKVFKVFFSSIRLSLSRMSTRN